MMPYSAADIFIAALPRLVDGVMVVSREILAQVLTTPIPLPVDILDAWFTRDGDVVLLLSGELPAQWVLAIVRRRDDGVVEFDEWWAVPMPKAPA